MAIVSSQSLAISREPDRGFVVFRYCEQQVTISVVLNLCDGPLVTMEHKRPLEVVHNNSLRVLY